MNQANTNCLKCGGEMEEGFIVDRGHYEMPRPSDWVEGAPVKSFWSGTKIKNKRKYQVKAFRCVNCGYLESYAVEENDSESSIFT